MCLPSIVTWRPMAFLRPPARGGVTAKMSEVTARLQDLLYLPVVGDTELLCTFGKTVVRNLPNLSFLSLFYSISDRAYPQQWGKE
jgi:hypothetical protein